MTTFIHGVMSSAPEADAVDLWAWTSEEVSLASIDAVVAGPAAQEFRYPVAGASVAPTSFVGIRATGLAPGTQYEYWFEEPSGSRSNKGSFRTASPASDREFVLALVGDVEPTGPRPGTTASPDTPIPSAEHLAERDDIDLVVSLARTELGGLHPPTPGTASARAMWRNNRSLGRLRAAHALVALAQVRTGRHSDGGGDAARGTAANSLNHVRWPSALKLREHCTVSALNDDALPEASHALVVTPSSGGLRRPGVKIEETADDRNRLRELPETLSPILLSCARIGASITRPVKSHPTARLLEFVAPPLNGVPLHHTVHDTLTAPVDSVFRPGVAVRHCYARSNGYVVLKVAPTSIEAEFWYGAAGTSTPKKRLTEWHRLPSRMSHA